MPFAMDGEKEKRQRDMTRTVARPPLGPDDRLETAHCTGVRTSSHGTDRGFAAS